MHLGNVYSALLSWLSARQQGGSWVLRIEDLDPGRSRIEYADQIRDDLRWLGLTWDEEYIQSQRTDIYATHLQHLEHQGLTYSCYCTRADILATQAPHESDGRVVYKGTCRGIAPRPGVRAATRLMVPNRDITFRDINYGVQTVNLADHCGDFILRRADGAWAYQLAVVVDDALMGITEVVRGRDLLLSVPQQIYLYELLGYTAPSFAHIPLFCNEQGQRLCKRDKSLELTCLRSHYSAEEVIGYIAHAVGLIPHPQPVTASELIPIFDWSLIPQNDIILDNTYLSKL